MPAAPSESIAKEISSKARGLDLFLARAERSRIDGMLSSSDVERIYAGAFLEIHAFVERSIERLFVGLLRGRLKSSAPGVKPLINVNSDRVAYAVVSSERAYSDWLPYQRFTIRRAKSFFSSGKPFTLLENADTAVFEDSLIIRNAIAHQSSSALRAFRSRLVEGKSLPPREQKPSGYLRGIHTIGQTRMENHVGRLVIAMNKLCQ